MTLKAKKNQNCLIYKNQFHFAKPLEVLLKEIHIFPSKGHIDLKGIAGNSVCTLIGLEQLP